MMREVLPPSTMSPSTSTLLPLIALVVICLISLFPPSSSTQETKINGRELRTHLIHIHSPRSPLYNPNSTDLELVQDLVRRSSSRYQALTNFIADGASPDGIKSPVTPLGPEYLMKFYIGTPEVVAFAVADTGSSLIWLQCLPCQLCYKHKGPNFDPSKSSSYEKLLCNSTQCGKLERRPRCYKEDQTCIYEVHYADTSYSIGDLSSDAFTFVETEGDVNYTFLDLTFGCGHKNKIGGRPENNPLGIVGLNNQKLSFVSQLEFSGFSHCFLPRYMRNHDSPMYFGEAALYDQGRTPMLHVEGKDFYYLKLEGISVNDNRIYIPPGTFNVTAEGKGGFIIDSGSALTRIHKNVFYTLLKNVVTEMPIRPVEEPTQIFELCYRTTMGEMEGMGPKIKFHFTGVDLVWSTLTTWLRYRNGLLCLAVVPSSSGLSVLGNYQQQNVNVGYNLKEGFVSFRSADCSKI